MTVTVCIPAYRSAPWLADAVGSALGQSYEDVRVIVAVDPPDDGSHDVTEDALVPWRTDKRLAVRRNERRLGWAENVNALVGSVLTPLYCILPHDDLWHPRFLETLVGALGSDPHTVVAYGDILRFGATTPVRKSVTLPPFSDRVTALLHFLIQGTEAQAWRGVTRTSVARRIGGFPTDRHGGFLVECEYALALHGVGTVVHVPRTCYFKRIHGSAVMSASRERLRQPLAERLAAWREHDIRMALLLTDALADMRADGQLTSLAHAAKEAALIRHRQQFVEPLLGHAETARVQDGLRQCGAVNHSLAGQVAANLHMVMRTHWLAAGNLAEADAALYRALGSAVTSDAATVHADLLLSRGHLLEAIERATEALRLGHIDDTRAAKRVIDDAYSRLGWQQPL